MDGVDFLRIRSVDRRAPATRGPDSLDAVFVVADVAAVAATGVAATSTDRVGTDDTVVVGGAIGGTTETTLGCSVVTMTGFGCTQKKRNGIDFG